MYRFVRLTVLTSVAAQAPRHIPNTQFQIPREFRIQAALPTYCHTADFLNEQPASLTTSKMPMRRYLRGTLTCATSLLAFVNQPVKAAPTEGIAQTNHSEILTVLTQKTYSSLSSLFLCPLPPRPAPGYNAPLTHIRWTYSFRSRCRFSSQHGRSCTSILCNGKGS